ncbi:Protein of unknown function [Weissella confusa LBAE C39-2]|nr:Protein of unknown function [Weissella confusa LBAE C39-2]
MQLVMSSTQAFFYFTFFG